MNDAIDAEHRAIAIREEAPQVAPLGLFGTNDPVEVIAKATRIADALKAVVVAKKLVAGIQGKEYLTVEAWTTLGSMLGVYPFTEWSRPLPEGNGWEARVVVRTRDGVEIAAAEAMCTRDERSWKSRDEYALRSMAMTRAVSKAMRLPLGFVAVLAGYDPTPEAEVPPEGFKDRKPEPPPPPVESEAQVERRRAEGIARIHQYCRTHGIDTEGADSPYRKLLLTDPAFCHHFESPDSEVTSKALTLDELQRLSMALQALVRERQAAQ
jgi:hypothetical protein